MNPLKMTIDLKSVVRRSPKKDFTRSLSRDHFHATTTFTQSLHVISVSLGHHYFIIIRQHCKSKLRYLIYFGD